MKCKKSSFVWILLSIIVLLTGMCSQIERTDSFLSFSKQVEESERIDDVNTDTLYFGNCTNKDRLTFFMTFFDFFVFN